MKLKLFSPPAKQVFFCFSRLRSLNSLKWTIKTTSLAGSLFCAYKARIPARPYWGSEYSVTCTTTPTTAEAVFLLFLFTGSRKRVVVFLNTYLIVVVIFFQLVLYIFFDFLFISANCIHIISTTPKFSIPIFIF